MSKDDGISNFPHNWSLFSFKDVTFILGWTSTLFQRSHQYPISDTEYTRPTSEYTALQ